MLLKACNRGHSRQAGTWALGYGVRTLSLKPPSRYMGLLLAPLQLSADWSFACIPPVEALADPRNLATAALYAWLLWVLVIARPWQARRLLPFCCDPGVLVIDKNLATAALCAWLLWVLLSARGPGRAGMPGFWDLRV